MKYRSLRWGISTLGCPECNLPQALEIADRYGIEFLEIRILNGSGNCHETLYLPENQSVMRRIAEAGRCRVLDSTFCVAMDKPGQRELLELTARTADDFNIPYLRIFGGGNYGQELDAERLACAEENFKWFKAQKFQTKLALETHDICSGSGACLKMQEACGEQLPIIWDAHHTRQVAGEDFAESFKLLSGNMIGVHFKDSVYAVKDGVRYCEYVLAGEGLVPLDELFTLLEENNVQVPITLEHEKFWRKHLPELEVMLDAWQQYCSDR